MKRLQLLDAVRGLAIINMIIFHICYDWQVLGGACPAWPQIAAVRFWQQCGCGLFVALGGMAFHLSGNNLRRGLKLNLLGLMIALLARCFFPEQAICCGILNFFGCALWLTAALAPLLRRVPPGCGMAAAVICYGLTMDVGAGAARLFGCELWRWPEFLYQDAFAVLGFHSAGFYSADYAPLLPHIFLFWGSWYCFAWLQRRGALACLAAPAVPVLSCAGRHSLSLYLAHQPVLVALAWLCGII